jgi:hypothetical protein
MPHPTGEMGPGLGSVPGDGGAGTSILGVRTGCSGGGWLGCPGWEGSGGRSGGVSGTGGCCCMSALRWKSNERFPAGLPNGPRLL